MNPIEAKKTSGGGGRKKIEIKRIEKEESRQVCFSKRCKGLFKKANELCTLCGAEVAVVAFSLAGKPYFFGKPSVDHVFRRFVDPSTKAMNQGQETKQPGALEEALTALWPVSKSFWWDIDLSSMGVEELREYENILLENQVIVAQAAQQSCFYHTPEAALGQIDGSPSASEVGEANYFLWLQQQDCELDGYDFNSGV